MHVVPSSFIQTAHCCVTLLKKLNISNRIKSKQFYLYSPKSLSQLRNLFPLAHLFSVGFTICTENDILCPSTLDSSEEKTWICPVYGSLDPYIYLLKAAQQGR